MVTPAQFERKMQEYKNQIDSIPNCDGVETQESFNKKADIWDQIYIDMLCILEQHGYTAGTRVLRKMFFGEGERTNENR